MPETGPVGRDAAATAMARLEEDMSGQLEQPTLEPTEKIEAVQSVDEFSADL